MCWNKGRLCWKIAKLFYFCHLKKLVRPETFGPYYACGVILSTCVLTRRSTVKIGARTSYHCVYDQFWYTYISYMGIWHCVWWWVEKIRVRRMITWCIGSYLNLSLSVCLSVCLSHWIASSCLSVRMGHLGSHWMVYNEILYWVFLENLSRKFRFA